MGDIPGPADIRNPSSSLFTSFLQTGIDRQAFISAWLAAHEIPHTVVELAGKRHIIVRFPPEGYDPRFRMKFLVAHYDRAGDTPGANDNSAACYQLMLFAGQLKDRTCHNIRILFTDGEEAAGTAGISGQGAYALGSGLRALNMTDTDVYVFDACGRGDTLILSSAGLSGKRGSPVRERLGPFLAGLHDRAAEMARKAAPGAWMTLRTPYSDNAGFLAAGIAAQVITILPHGEAERLLACLSGDAGADGAKGFSLAELETAITTNRPVKDGSPLALALPETWRLMHTGADTASTLTAPAFVLLSRFLNALAESREPAL